MTALLLLLLILPAAIAGEPLNLPKAPRMDESNSFTISTTSTTPTTTTVKIPIILPDLKSVDTLGEDFLKLIPPEIIDFIRNLDVKEKEEIVRWAQEYAESDDADGGSQMLMTMPEFKKKFEPLKWIVSNLTEAVATSDDAKYFVSSLLETVCHICAIYLDGEEIEPEYLKFMMRQLARTYDSLTLESRKLLDDRGKIIINVMAYPEFVSLYTSWMVPPPIKDSIYPNKEDYTSFDSEVPNREEEEEEVIEEDDEGKIQEDNGENNEEE